MHDTRRVRPHFSPGFRTPSPPEGRPVSFIMAFRCLHCMDEPDHFRSAESVVIDGPTVAGKLLWDAAFEIRPTEDGTDLIARAIPEDLPNREDWEAVAVERAKTVCVMWTNAKFEDEGGVIYDDAKPHSEQVWNCPPVIYIDGKKVVSP